MERKRSRIDIINDMLLSIQRKGGEIKPTHLMYKANLSHQQMKSYLEELVQKEFVQEVKKKNYTYLMITDKGHQFVEKFQQMKEFEDAFGL
jgi:predicted transcriptional regulator